MTTNRNPNGRKLAIKGEGSRAREGKRGRRCGWEMMGVGKEEGE
jgi:hypothetical protein